MSVLTKFLNAYKVEKGSAFTHTALKGGCYYIPADVEEEQFLPLYTVAIENGEDLSITEKHRDMSPLLIDLDFRQTQSDRQYTDKHIKAFLALLTKQIKDYFIVSDDAIKFYVLEKPEPRKNKDKGYKDGLHIICPDVVSKPEVQYIIRQNILKNGMKDVFSNIFTNSYEDIYDEAVIERNNWFLYGSKKPDEEYPWVVSKIYDANINEIENSHTDEQLINILSIRNKFDDVKVKDDKIDEIKAFKESKKPKESEPSVSKTITKIPSDFDTIYKLVMMLKKERADNYHDWLNVGLCLKNIDEMLCEYWVEFSKQSIKFIKGECEKLWGTFQKKQGGLTEGSLRFWAKQDNPDEYKKLMFQSVSKLIYNSRNETHTDIAKVVYHLYRDIFVCCYFKDKPTWYEFKNHRWVVCPDAVSLKLKISNEVARQYSSASSHYNAKASIEEDEYEQKLYLEIAKKMNTIATKLKMVSYKSSVVSECKELFYIPNKDFFDKLDENKYLLGFDNGVFDLESGCFRAGEPSDLITFSVGYDYTEKDTQTVEFINNFMNSVVPTDTLPFLWNTCSYPLCGVKNMEMFEMWQGEGANGKGALGRLLISTFGDYCYCPDISIFTCKKTNRSGADPELAMTKGKRLVMATEPSENDKFQVGQLKAWTGGDPITARALFKEPITFEAQFLVIIQMNKRPQLSDFDKGIVRRLKLVQFPYTFVDNPTRENERQGDSNLKQLFEKDIKIRQTFMSMLIDNYIENIQGNRKFETPERVQQFTQEYLDANNKVGAFLDDVCEKSDNPDDMVISKELYDLFRDSEFFNGCLYDSFKEQMEICGYKSFKNRRRNVMYNKNVFAGLLLKENKYLIQDDDEIDL